MYTDHIISDKEHAFWMEKVLVDSRVNYQIFEMHGSPIGQVNLVQIDKINTSCYWGFYVGVENPPSGVGSVMEFLAIEYIFEKLLIRKLCCEVFVFNKTVIKLHKKFGFVEEGCLKEHVFKGEKYEDVLSLALFSSQWLEVKSRLEKIIFR
jgi:UDP-4-amino-4,6-dideoxy-N-acetyl-beta-L-altrosamine N-acetyltransferase